MVWDVIDKDKALHLKHIYHNLWRYWRLNRIHGDALKTPVCLNSLGKRNKFD